LSDSARWCLGVAQLNPASVLHEKPGHSRRAFSFLRERINSPGRQVDFAARYQTFTIVRFGSILLKVRQAKPGGVGSHMKENATENF
jgi:hypothetical protein